jgi:UDPglucose 6-dehydrogenase
MEISHKVEGCNVDEVSGALELATDRLLSPAYLSGGMGDGGGCHPRDNIALSWLARELGLSYDFFESIMLLRERQTDWLVDLVVEHHERRGFDHRRVGIYGRAFKAGTNLTVGSPATLLRNLLEERGFEVEMFDPYIDAGPCPFDEARVYVVATKHPEFTGSDWEFPAGSVVIDPWRAVDEREGVEIIAVGVGRANGSPSLQDELRIGAAQNGRPSDPERATALDLA